MATVNGIVSKINKLIEESEFDEDEILSPQELRRIEIRMEERKARRKARKPMYRLIGIIWWIIFGIIIYLGYIGVIN